MHYLSLFLEDILMEGRTDPAYYYNRCQRRREANKHEQTDQIFKTTYKEGEILADRR